MNNQLSTQANAFDSYNGTYNAAGNFSKEIKIPSKTWNNNGENILLKPENVERHSISSGSTYAFLEIISHNNPYYESMENEALSNETHTASLSSVNGFKLPEKGEIIRIITVHDEDFRDLPKAEALAYIDHFKSYIAACGYDNTGACSLDSFFLEKNNRRNTRPRTIGSGILMP